MRSRPDVRAARAINYREEDFVAVVKAETRRQGVDVILDMVGGDYVQRNIAPVPPGAASSICLSAELHGTGEFRPVSPSG